jgi:hypothetical protein
MGEFLSSEQIPEHVNIPRRIETAPSTPDWNEAMRWDPREGDAEIDEWNKFVADLRARKR